MGWTVVQYELKNQSSLSQAPTFQMDKLDHDLTWFPSALADAEPQPAPQANVQNQPRIGQDANCQAHRHLSMHMLLGEYWQLRKAHLSCTASDRNELKGTN